MWNFCYFHDVEIYGQCNGLNVKVKGIGIYEHIPLFIMKHPEIGSNPFGEHRNNRPYDNIEHVKITLDFEIAMKVEEKIAIWSVLNIGQKIKQFEIRAIIHIIKIKWRDADGMIKNDTAIDPNYEK